MHDVQNLGAVQTYLRRYLYVNAFEIVEHDAIDKTEQKRKEPARNTEPTLTAAQLNEFGDMVKKDPDPAQSSDRLKELVVSLGYQKLSEVKQSEYEKLKDKYIDCGLPFSLEDKV